MLLLSCAVYAVCAVLTSGFQGDGVKGYVGFLKKQCTIPFIVAVGLAVTALVGAVLGWQLFRAGSYRDLLTVEDGDFATEVEEISYDQIPMLDAQSAMKLGDRKLGELADMVSQFEVAEDYTQINYQGRPVRVTPLRYGDIIKWLNNRAQGLPAYLIIDMVTQNVEVVRLDEGIHYTTAEHFSRNLYRHLRFHYPTFMFDDPAFEIDENGDPWWVCPRVSHTIGLFGGRDIVGAVLVNAVTGESAYYEVGSVPNWVDHVFTAELIMQQYDYHGTYVNGFINSLFGQRDVTVTTEGYNYIAIGDDVYMYTGVTSATSDQSNLGFLLCNQRTKETKFYTIPGATEQSARASAEGMVQDQGYRSTFPLLLNISDQPTYFIALKDDRQLVKKYAMVNVGQFNLVGIGDTVAACEQDYLRLLGEKGIAAPEERIETQVSGTVAEIRSAVLDGTTYYFIRLEGEEVFYSLSAVQNPVAVLLNAGDLVTIDHAPQAEGESSSILDGYTLTVEGKAAPEPSSVPEAGSGTEDWAEVPILS